MTRQRNPITALCPACRFANSVGLRELLAQQARSICCRRCRAVLPIPLLPGLPPRRGPAPDDQTPPPPTVPRLAVGERPAASTPPGDAETAPARGLPVELWYGVGVLIGLVGVGLALAL